MNDNILPVEIQLIPPSQSQIRKSMAEIEAAVAASGRRIGQVTSKTITNSIKGIRTDKWIKEQ